MPDCSSHEGAEAHHVPADGHHPSEERRATGSVRTAGSAASTTGPGTAGSPASRAAEDRARGIGVHHMFAEGEPEHDETRTLHGEIRS